MHWSRHRLLPTLQPLTSLSAAIGPDQPNRPKDVLLLQQLLNKLISSAGAIPLRPIHNPVSTTTQPVTPSTPSNSATSVESPIPCTASSQTATSSTSSSYSPKKAYFSTKAPASARKRTASPPRWYPLVLTTS